MLAASDVAESHFPEQSFFFLTYCRQAPCYTLLYVMLWWYVVESNSTQQILSVCGSDTHATW